MRAYQFRQEARSILKNLPGRIPLFLSAIILSIFSISITVRETLLELDGIEISISASFFPLIISLLITFFTLSASFTILDVIRHKRQEVGFSDSTSAFSGDLFGKLLWTIVLKGIYLFLWSLISIVGVVMAIFGLFLSIDLGQPTATFDMNLSTTSIWLIIVGILIYFLGLAIVAIKQYSYSFAEYLVYDRVSTDSYNGASAAISESKKLLKGYKWKLFCLDFSFIGWYLLTGLTMGLLYFYTLPYATTARLLFYENRLALEKG